MPLLLSCEGGSEVQKGANDYDNADKEQLQEQMQDAQQQQEQQQQQQELLKRLRQDCRNMPFPEQPQAPVRAADVRTAAADLLLLADFQLAWGGGGGSGHDRTNCP